MDRRVFLGKSLTLVTAGSCLPFLSGCHAAPSLRVHVLKGSLPVQLVPLLKAQLPENTQLQLFPVSQLASLFESLKAQKTIPDVITLGDGWLPQAIAAHLIEPLDSTKLSFWSELPLSWQTLVQRDRQGKPDPKGEIWGIPYSWGTTAIAYRPDRLQSLGVKPTDWSDLWRPELKGRISLLDHPRAVIGLTLKRLGYSYNQSDLEQIPELLATLQKLHQQVLFYSSEQYLQPLIQGDTWMAVGWSTDILPALSRYHLKAIIPRSGTALWANLWVQPTQGSQNPAIAAWMNSFLNPEFAVKMAQWSDALSPLIPSKERHTLPPSLVKDQVKFLEAAVLEASEFLLPLSESTQRVYDQLWQSIRS